MADDRRDLVLGFCANYGLRQVEPFLATLRAHLAAAHVCLFAAGMDIGFYHFAEDSGIEVRNARPYLALGFHGVMARYFMYDDYLSAVGNHFRKVLLSDLRDVLFQGDPFAEPLDAAVSFAAEDNTIGACRQNSGWVREVYGEAVLAELAPRRISCSGTTIGEVPAIGLYVKDMREQLAGRSYDRQRFGLDQAAHNHIVWTARPPYGRLDTGDRIVKTLGYTTPDKVLIADGQIHVGGHAPPILHQFDRHPKLVDLVTREPRFRLAG